MPSRWNPWAGLEGLPRGVWVLFAVTLVNRMGTMVLPFLVLYLTRDVGFSAARAGLVLTVYGIGALIAAPLTGRLCDRLGAPRVMQASLVLGALVFFLFPFARSWWWILLASAALAIASEGFRPASLSIVATIVEASDLKRAFAAIRLAINLGMSIGPALGGFLATSSFRWLFVIDGATSLAAAIVLFVWPIGMPPRAPTLRAAAAPAAPDGARAAAAPRARPPGALRDTNLLVFLFGVILVAMVFFQHQGAMPIYLVRDLHLRESTYGLLFTINTILIVLLEVRLNVATSHWPHRRSLALGTLLLGFGFGGLALCREIWGVLATVIVWTFGEMMALPPMSAHVAEIAPEERRGEYMGVYTMSWGAAFTVGPWLGTVALDRFGGRALWAGVFVFAMIAVFMLARIRPRRAAPAAA